MKPPRDLSDTVGLAPPHRGSMDLADLLSIQERLLIIEPLRRRRSEHLARNATLRVDELDACERLLVLGLLRLTQMRGPADIDLDLSGPGAFEVSSPMEMP